MSAGTHSDVAPPASQDEPVTLATHPRASRQIRMAKGWGGLIPFVLIGWLSWRAGMDPFDAGLRALGAGLVGFLAAWAASVSVWRMLVQAEHRAAVAEAREAALGGPDDALERHGA